MDTPKILDTNTYNLKNNDQSINLILSNLSNSLVIKIIEVDSILNRCYSADFTLEKLQKLNNYFKLFESIQQLISELSNLIEENNITFSYKNNSIDLIINLPIKIIEKVIIPIPETEQDIKEVVSGLCTTVNTLRKKVQKLENELLLNSKIPEEKLKENLSSNEIILNEEEKKMIFNWILTKVNPEKKNIKMILLYKSTNDGDSASTFHSKCNSKGNTLSLIRNTKGFRCGGFTTQSWSSSGSNLNDNYAFLFSLDYKECYFNYDGKNAIYDNSGLGPCFGNSGNDLYIANQCRQNYNSYCNFPYCYDGIRVRVLSGGYYNFKVHEIEVFKIEFID